MKKTIFMSITAMLLLAFGICARAGSSPVLTAGLSVDRKDQPVYLMDDRVGIKLDIRNPGPGFFTVEGFSKKEFERSIRIIGPDGRRYRVMSDKKYPEPLHHRSIYIDGKRFQVDSVEEVKEGWKESIRIKDAVRAFGLTAPGWYTAQAVITLRTYSRPDAKEGEKLYAKIDSALPVEIVTDDIRFARVADMDKDGFSWPVAHKKVAEYPDPDCDDNNPEVNPKATEILGNGIDDDCNEKTLDAALPGMLVVSSSREKKPLSGLDVRVYDTKDGSCAERIGVSQKNYKSIWLSCNTVLYGFGKTDRKGVVSMNLQPGSYLALGRYDENTFFGGTADMVSSKETMLEIQ